MCVCVCEELTDCSGSTVENGVLALNAQSMHVDLCILCECDTVLPGLHITQRTQRYMGWTKQCISPAIRMVLALDWSVPLTTAVYPTTQATG